MAWREGYHCRSKDQLPNTNEELMKIEGDINTREAQIAFAKFCQANPTFAAQLLMGIDLYPFQDIMIRAMFDKDFFLGICGRGLGKTTIAGIFIPLYALFNPGVRIGITSITFRQARAIFEAIESFIDSREGHFLKQCVVGKASHKNDAWELTIGVPGGKKSKIVAVPLGSGDKIRGYRFNVLVIDEMLLISERIVNEVLQPFMAIQADPRRRQKLREAEDKLIAAGRMEADNRTVFQNNKLIGLTSASYEFEYLYDLYKSYQEVVFDESAENVNHGIFQLSYLAAPEGLYEKGVIHNAKRTYSKAQFDREYMAHFTGDSSGFFSAKKLKEVTIEMGEKPTTLITGRSDRKYILAIDPNYDDAETADHFAMCVVEIDHENEAGTVVHAYALPKSDLKSRALYIKYLFDHFDIVYVIVDNAGGSKFIKDVNTLDVLNFKLDFFEADFDKDDPEKIQKAKDSYSPAGGAKKAMVHAQVFNAHWNRLSNEALQANIDRKKIWFASRVDPDKVGKPDSIDIEALHFNEEEYQQTRAGRELKMYDFIEHQYQMLELTKSEMSLIEAFTNASGTMRFDLPPEISRQDGPNRTRKDSYTVAVLANWGLECYFLLLKTHKKRISRVTPQFIG